MFSSRWQQKMNSVTSLEVPCPLRPCWAFFCLFFKKIVFIFPTGPLCIFYGFWFYALTGFLNVRMSGSLVLYIFLAPFLGLFAFSLYCPILMFFCCLILFFNYYPLDACGFSNERQKEDISEWEGKWKEPGGVEGRGIIIKTYCKENKSLVVVRTHGHF